MFAKENLGKNELNTLLKRKESHYLDFKGKEISGKDLQRHLAGFANADGGEIYVGINELDKSFIANGFSDIESSNQLIQAAIIDLKPAIEGLLIDFLEVNQNNHIIKLVIPKSPKVHYTSSGDCYVRLSAQTQKIKGDEIASLAYSKGFFKYEEQAVDAAEIDDILDAGYLQDYLSG